MRRYEINKANGRMYSPENMAKAVSNAGFENEIGKEYTDDQVKKINVELKKLPKDPEYKRRAFNKKSKKKWRR